MTGPKKHAAIIGSLAFLHQWLAAAMSLMLAMAYTDPGRLSVQQLENVMCVLYAPTCLVLVVDQNLHPWTSWLMSGVSSVFWAVVVYGGCNAARRRR